jgi:Flp pilus assembly protein TadD
MLNQGLLGTWGFDFLGYGAPQGWDSDFVRSTILDNQHLRSGSVLQRTVVRADDGGRSGGFSTYQNLAKIGFAALLSAGVLAACAGGSAECTGPASLQARIAAHHDASAYADLGTWFYENHQAECAVETYRSGLKMAPNSARLHYLLGSSLYAEGHLEEAVAELKEAARLNPQELQAHLLLGAALAKLGRNQEAASEWSAALKIDPNSAAALDGQAKSLLAAGDYASVIRNLRSVARDENLAFDLAIAYRDAGMLDEAEQTLKQGLEADRGSDALTAALVALYDETNYAAANEMAEKIARQKPDDLEAQRIYLRSLVMLGDSARAVPLARKLLALAPHDADLLNLNGVLERKAGDYQAARKHLEEAVALDPKDPNSRVNLGLVLEELNDPAGAKVQLEKALALGRDEPQIHFELSKVLRTLGETAAAQQQLALFQQKLKQESDRASAITEAKAAAEAAKAGDNQKAAELYRQACAAEPQNAGLAYQLALVLDNLGDRPGERAALKEAIQANPQFVPAQYQLGYMDLQAGDNAGAERQFRLTVDAVPDNAQAWIGLVAALGAESRFDEARKAAATALRLNPSSAATLKFLLGSSLYAAGHLEEAVALLKEAVRLNPQELQAHLLLGAALVRLGRNQEAASEWSAALKIDPNSKSALDGQAKSLIAAGDYASVIRNLRSEARDENLTLDLAIAYRDAGMLDETEQTLKQGLEADPGSDALTAALVALYDETNYAAATELSAKIAREKPDDLNAQRIYLRTLVTLGDNGRAVPLGRRLLALAPHDADLLNLKGVLEMRAGDYQTARKHLEEAVALDPNNSDPHMNLGLVLVKLKDPAGAKIQLQKALALGKDDPQVHFELSKVLRTLGEPAAAQQQLALFQQKEKQESDRALAVSMAAQAAEAVKAGDNQKAAGLYRQACAVEPQNAGLAYKLALVLDNLGDRAGERAALEQAIQSNPHFFSAQFQLGHIDLQAGDYAGAERQFRLTADETPDNAQVWTALAATLGAESRYEEARKAVATALQLDPGNATALNLSRMLGDGGNQH